MKVLPTVPTLEPSLIVFFSLKIPTVKKSFVSRDDTTMLKNQLHNASSDPLREFFLENRCAPLREKNWETAPLRKKMHFAEPCYYCAILRAKLVYSMTTLNFIPKPKL